MHSFYFSALVIPACIGLVTWISLGTYSIVYSIIVLAWSLVFVEGWRLRERMLAIRWGTYKVSNIGKERPEFKGTMQTRDQVHGGVKAVFPWYLRDLRILSSIPVLLLFAFGLALLIAMIFTSEVLINEVYDGKGKSLLSLLPTIAFAGAVPRVNLVYPVLFRDADKSIGCWYLARNSCAAHQVRKSQERPYFRKVARTQDVFPQCYCRM